MMFIVVLSGCAKVIHEDLPCPGVKPNPPSVQNTIGTIGSAVDIMSNTNSGVVVMWTGPNGLSSTTQTGYLSVFVNDSSNFGLYTARIYYDGCISDPDTFYLVSGYSGSPPCTIPPANNNYFIATGITSFQFIGAASGFYGTCYSTVYDINTTTANGFTFDLYTVSPPVPGYYYPLTSDCGVSNDRAYIVFSGAGTNYYQSVSGNLYCNIISGTKYITLCGAIFKNVSTNATFTMSGNCQIY